MVSKYDVGALKIINIEGIGPKFEKVLKEQKIETTGDLLKKADTQEKRLTLSETINIPLKLINKWVSHSDLIRIKGIGEEWSELINVLGIETVQELGEQDPKELHEKSEKFDVSKTHMVRKKPTLRQIQGWVREAKKLPVILKEPLTADIVEPEIQEMVQEDRKPFEFVDPYTENVPRERPVTYREPQRKYSIRDDPLLPITAIVAVVTLLVGLAYLLL